MNKMAPSFLAAALAACAADPAFEPTTHDAADGKADASALATVLNFSFDGQVLTDSAFNAEQVIRDQLLYTIGHLNFNKSVGRLDRLTLTNITKTAQGDKTRIGYHAELPVAWGSKTNLPTSYEFTLPLDASYSGTSSFTEKYKESCVDFAAHGVDQGSMWYYYRPNASGCALAAGDVFKTTAKVAVSPTNTTGKYPEYHKVWEDGELNVVAVFGKYEDGATTSDDAGIDAYNTFVAQAQRRVAQLGGTSTPTTVPSSPGVAAPDVAFTATLPGGKKLQIVALLVDNVRTTDPHFTQRYEQLSTHADLIAYNGHAGLGQNVRALARRGQWVSGQYVVVFMNGCDTFAYVDGSLAETRSKVNADDPSGTKYMEFVVNAMPSFFHSDAAATMAMINGLMAFDAPKTYEQIFTSIDRSQVVLVTGEQDNVYFPGFNPGGGSSNEVLRQVGSVDRGETLRFSAEVQPGNYIVALGDDPAQPGGDADLLVRLGAAPTGTEFDCHPFLDGNAESCRLTVTTATQLFASVSGFSTGSTGFTLIITRE